jgi:pilus assembly protein CpaB
VTRSVQSKTGGSSNGLEGIRSDMILANIRVLAIDAIYGAPLADGAEAAKAGQGAAIIGSRATLELTERDATLLNTARTAGDISLTLRSIADIAAPAGATGQGRVYRDGVAQESEGVKVFRYGNETVSTATAG